jgi:hypothetical protein
MSDQPPNVVRIRIRRPITPLSRYAFAAMVLTSFAMASLLFTAVDITDVVGVLLVMAIMLAAPCLIMWYVRSVSRHRPRDIVRDKPNQDIGAQAQAIIEATRYAAPQLALEELARLRAQRRHAPHVLIANTKPVELPTPLAVPIEPVPLNEAEAAFDHLELAAASGPDSADTARPRAPARTASPAARHILRRVRLMGGWITVIILSAVLLHAAWNAYAHPQMLRRDIRSPWVWVAGLAFLAAIWLILSRRRQWFLVAGGIIVRRPAGYTWNIHVFDRARSDLYILRDRRRLFHLIVTDGAAFESHRITPNEVSAVLRAWCSPLTPPPPDRLSDLGNPETPTAHTFTRKANPRK